jgi:GNAT superfamily N-acetyltransferase
MAAEFRFAEAGDVAMLVALINAAFQVEKFFKIGERTDIAEIEHYLETGRFLLLEDGRELLGSVYVEARGERGYLGMLSVAPERQRQGIGTRLMAAAEEFCREQGCRHMDITVVDVRTELPPLYEKYGYKVTGTAPFPAEQMPVRMPCSFVIMSKPLMEKS